jgi:hypothetical protein
MEAAVEEVRASGPGDGDPLAQAVETLAALATIYVRYALAARLPDRE